MNRRNRNKGQGMTEYLIIVAIIAVSAIGVTRVTGQHLTTGFSRIAKALEGTKDKGNYDVVGTDYSQSRDMGDFTEKVK